VIAETIISHGKNPEPHRGGRRRENEEREQFLRERACDEMQGHGWRTDPVTRLSGPGLRSPRRISGGFKSTWLEVRPSYSALIDFAR